MSKLQQERVIKLQETLAQMSESAQRLNPAESENFKTGLTALESSLRGLSISFQAIKLVCERGCEDHEQITV